MCVCVMSFFVNPLDIAVSIIEVRAANAFIHMNVLYCTQSVG